MPGLNGNALKRCFLSEFYRDTGVPYYSHYREVHNDDCMLHGSLEDEIEEKGPQMKQTRGPHPQKNVNTTRVSTNATSMKQ